MTEPNLGVLSGVSVLCHSPDQNGTMLVMMQIPGKEGRSLVFNAQSAMTVISGRIICCGTGGRRIT